MWIINTVLSHINVRVIGGWATAFGIVFHEEMASTLNAYKVIDTSQQCAYLIHISKTIYVYYKHFYKTGTYEQTVYQSDVKGS